MGNVYASSPSTLPPPPPNQILSPQSLMPPPLSLNEDGNSGPPPPPLNESSQNNPGSMEELHKKCKDIFPVIFDGGKFMLNKPLSNHFQVSHSVNFPTAEPPGYRFGATYVGTNQPAPTEAYPVILGELNPSGDLNANIIHQLCPNVRAKFVAQIQKSKWQATQVTTDWKGEDFTASLTLGNIDLIGGSGVAVTHYLQKVTDKIDLGAELAYQFGPQVPGGRIAVQSFAGRYSGNNYTASGTLGPSGIHLCYHQKASETVQFGVELETSLRMQESTAQMAYQVDIPKANFTFRGTADSNWTVGAVLEKKLMPLPFTFALSAMLNHPKNQFRLGCGFIVG